MRAVEQPNGKTFFQYIAPDETILASRKDMMHHIKNPPQKQSSKTELSSTKLANIKVKQFRKKIPMRKKLVSNQVIVTKATTMTRRAFINDKNQCNFHVSSKSFRYEPVIYVPKIKDMLADQDDYDEDYSNFSVEVNDLIDMSNIPNNIKDIEKELVERQLDYESKLSSSEDEDEKEESLIIPSTTSGRTLRKRNSRLVYEEPPLEEEIDNKFYKDLRQQVKAGSVDRNSGKGTPTPLLTVEESKVESAGENEDLEDENEEDYMSDSWEAELFSLKRNPRDKMRFQDEDNEILNDWFAKNPYPDKKEQFEISKILMVQAKNIKHWFQSKRVKLKENGKGLNKKENKRKLRSEMEVEEDTDGFNYCKRCKQPFSNVDNLQLHLKRFHKKKLKLFINKKYNFEKCDRKFNLKSPFNSQVLEADKPGIRNAQEKEVIKEPIIDEMKEIDEYVESKRSYSNSQLEELEKVYLKSKGLKPEELTALSKKTNLSENAVKGWFSSQKKLDTIEEEVKERILSSPSILKFSGRSHHIEREKWISNRNTHCHGKRSTLNHFQKSYLKYYFMQKQFLDDEDINELSFELMLPRKTITNFFEDARERKNISIAPTPIKGKNRGRPKKLSFDQSKIYFDSDDEDLFDMSDLEDQSSSLPIIFASKSKGSQRIESGREIFWTLYQQTFLDKFYSRIEDPDDNDIDFVVSIVKSTRQSVIDWFNGKKRDRDYEKKESVIASRTLLSDLILQISESKNFSFVPPLELSCKYCGDKFGNQIELEEHESIEAEEFEPEKFSMNNDEVSFESPEELSKLDDTFVSDDDDTESITYNSSQYEDSVDFSNSGFKRSQQKFEKSKNSSNAFMLWFKDEKPKLKEDVSRSNDMYRMASQKWKTLPDYLRKPYIDEADKLTEEYINYGKNSRDGNEKDLSRSSSKRIDFEDFSSEGKLKSITTYKGYFCKRCQLGFCLKSNLYKHLSFVHPGVSVEPIKQHILEVGIASGKDYSRCLQCDDCKEEFKTRSELSRHLFLHYQELYCMAEPAESISNGSIDQYYNDDSRSNLFYDEEPVTFEAFRNYFDSADVEACNTNDPQNFYDFGRIKNMNEKTKSTKKTSSVVRKDYDDLDQRKVRTKIRFTAEQRGILLKNFKQSIKMSKYDYKSLYEELAETLDLPMNNIKVWFQNAKSARKKGNPLFL